MYNGKEKSEEMAQKWNKKEERKERIRKNKTDCTYNLTPRRFPATTVAVEKQ